MFELSHRITHRMSHKKHVSSQSYVDDVEEISSTSSTVSIVFPSSSSSSSSLATESSGVLLEDDVSLSFFRLSVVSFFSFCPVRKAEKKKQSY